MMISQLDGITVTILASPINDFTIGRVLCVGTGHAGPPTEGLLPSPHAGQAGWSRAKQTHPENI